MQRQPSRPAASLLGTAARILPQANTNWEACADLWSIYVDKPGALKYPAVSEVLRPLSKLDETDREAKRQADVLFGREMAKHKMLLDAKEACFRTKSRGTSGDPETALREWEKVRNQESQPPIERRRIVNDATPEKLQIIHGDNSNGLMVHRDEIVTLLRAIAYADYLASHALRIYGPPWFKTPMPLQIVSSQRGSPKPRTPFGASFASPETTRPSSSRTKGTTTQ